MLSIKVDGLAEARAALRKAGASSEQLREPFLAAARIVADAAERTVPRRTGQLAGSHGADATQRYGLVLADQPYAGAIHFGWSTRGLGRGRTKEELQEALGGAFSARALNRSVRLSKVRMVIKERDASTGRFAKGAKATAVQGIRGGPIRPNPWIYRAGDTRGDEVMLRFERHMDAIATAFNGGSGI